MTSDAGRACGRAVGCLCCTGVQQRTPRRVENTPGRSTLDYRTGTHPDFVASMRARLASPAYPALRALRTRDTRDFSVALLDAFAACADVLTFYQERIVTESFLRTATERRSLVGLGRLLGYEPRPGVAAETFLAFTMQDGPGAPASLHLDPGVKVQSVPGPGELPQTFETVEELQARQEWSHLRAETSTPPLPVVTDCFLQGVDLNLRPGDALLFVGDEVREDITRDNWDFRVLETATVDVERDLTHVTWADPLGSILPTMAPAADPEVYVFRQRGGIFGHNAPLWRAMPLSYRQDYARTSPSSSEWPDFTLSPVDGAVDLEQVQPGTRSGDWIVLLQPGYTELFVVTGTAEVSRAAFGLSGKVTRATLRGENYALYRASVRETTVFTAPEQLRFARRPVVSPVFGPTVALEGEHSDIEPGHRFALSGPRAHLRVTVAGQSRSVTTATGDRRLLIDEVLEVLEPPQRLVSGDWLAATPAQAMAGAVRWRVRDEQGREGRITARLGELALATPPRDAAHVSEVVTVEGIAGAVTVADGRTVARLEAATRHCYDPSALEVNANVARATHGESVVQVLGSGDAARAHQRFSLLQVPLTFVSADSEEGVASTMRIEVNDTPWDERGTLVDATSEDHAYTLRTDGESSAVVQFGDGERGARLPNGRENVLARYRKGIGSGGNVATGQLSQLLSRPLGLVGATNPVPGSGGVDPDGIEEARTQIPRGVRTLGRAVSLRDYEDFALGFPGITRAHVSVLNLRAGKTIVITVAGQDGAVLAPDSTVLQRLVGALKASGDPHVTFEVVPYQSATFNVRLRVKLRPGAVRSEVLARVEAELHRVYGFKGRRFAEPVVRSRLIACVDGVAGVEAVDLEHLYRGGTPTLSDRLVASTARADGAGRAVGAELLTLAEGPLAWLGEMP